ncbi:MAG: hypothetical protein ACREUE_13020 [Panacagrimonas sp.]
MRALLIIGFALPPLYLLMLVSCLLWSVNEPALSVYSDQMPRMVSSDLRKNNQRGKTQDGGREGWKAYVLFPSVLSEPKVVTVRRLVDGSTVVTESVAEFWVRAGLALLSVAGVVWFAWKVATMPSATPKWTERDRKRDEAMRDAR